MTHDNPLVERLRTMLKSSMSWEACAKELQISVPGVRAIASAAGITHPCTDRQCTSKVWPGGRIAEMRRLRDKGLSAGQIGKRMGVTRNVIIGKLHRLGERTNIPSGSSGGIAPRAPRKPSASVTVSVAEPAPLTHPDGSRITLLEAGFTMCRWIADTATEGLICAHKTKPGEPWCPHHRARAWAGKPQRPMRDHHLAKRAA